MIFKKLFRKDWIIPETIRDSLYFDMLEQKHVLVAGATGSGKSVVINGLIYNIMGFSPSQKKLVLIDFKRVELSYYKNLPHTISFSTDLEAAEKALDNALQDIENRFVEMEKKKLRLYDKSDVYIVIDEFADLMLLGGKRIENKIIRIAQIGRAARYHLILATQTVYHTVITSQIKANMTCYLALRTTNKIQSRLITESPGCEKLPDFGYGFYKADKAREPELYKLYMYDEKEILKNVALWEKQK